MFQKEIFCTRLKNLRLEKGLTLEQFGKLFDVSKQGVSHWETGIRYPSLPVLVQIAEFYAVSTDYLLGLRDTPNSAEQDRAEL